MSDSTYAVVVSGLDMSSFLSLLPPLKVVGTCSSYPWPDCDAGQIAVAHTDGFILAAGSLLELIGEGLALEASRRLSGLYLFENSEEDQYCASKFNKGRPAGRVEVSSGDIVEDSMRMFPANSADNDDKNYGRINTDEVLGDFIGCDRLPVLEWTSYESQ